MEKTTYRTKYEKEAIPLLQKAFAYKNVNQVPKLLKIVLNTSIKDGINDAKIFDKAAAEIAQITGQKPVITRARKAISNFKLRAGVPIGVKVTLRGARMYEFMNRLVNVALPRVRDFKGVAKGGFDKMGNYTLGLTEQIIFPEINYDKVDRVFGMNITFVTTAKTDGEGMVLLEALGVPFRKN